MRLGGRLTRYTVSLGFIVAVLIIAVWSERLGRAYDFRENMAVAAATTATALLAVTLFVERALAVLNAIIFGDEHREAEAKLLEGDADGVQQMKRVLSKKERVRLFGAFLAGALVSAAGVRTLEGLLAVPAQSATINSFLVPVDVVLTAGLIAGGSNSLAFLVQLIKDVLAPPEQAEAPLRGGPLGQVTGSGGGTGVAGPVAASRSRFFRARLTSSG